MSMFKYFRDVILGRIGHWNETNNTVVRELWNKLGDLDSP